MSIRIRFKAGLCDAEVGYTGCINYTI